MLTAICSLLGELSGNEGAWVKSISLSDEAMVTELSPERSWFSASCRLWTLT